MKRMIHGDPSSALDWLGRAGVRSGGGWTVLTPHPRAACALGVPLWTLEGEAIRRLNQHHQRVISAVEQQILLAGVLRERERDEGGHSRAIDPRGAARRLRHGIETLLRSTEAPEEALKGESEKQLVELAEILAGYRSVLAREGLVDPAEVLWRAARLEGERLPLLVWGYFAPRGDELAFLDTLAGDDSHLILPLGPESILAENRGWVAWLEGRGWTVAPALPEASPPIVKPVGWRTAERCWRGEGEKAAGAIELWSEPTVEEEVRAVLREVKRLLVEGISAGEIVLVTNQEAIYGARLRATAWEYGIPVRLPNQRPLGESIFGAWLRLALKAIGEDLPFEATLGTLAHRAGPGLSNAILHRLLEKHPRGADAWREGLAGGEPPDPKWTSWLAALAWPREASRAVYTRRLEALLDLRRSSAQAADSSGAGDAGESEFRQELMAMEGDDENQSIPLAQQIEEWLELISILTLPGEPAPLGQVVEVHRPEALSGASCRQLFVIGMMEGALPGSPAAGPLLDFQVRQRLAERGIDLGSAVAQVRRQALIFSCVLGTATERIVFSRARQQGGEAAIRSPYLDRLGLEEKRTGGTAGENGRVVDVIASPEEARRHFSESTPDWGPDPLLPALRHAIAVERRRLGPLPPDSYDGIPGVPLEHFESHRWSASQLISIGTCAFQWFVRYGLEAGEAGEPEEGLSPRLLGTLYHKALELCLSGLPPGEDLRAHALRRLESCFLEAEREVELSEFPAQLPGWRAQRREHLNLLAKAIQADDFLAPGATVVGQEVRFRGEFHGLPVRGVIDRIDRLPDTPGEEGRLLFLDYKTAKKAPLGIQNEAGKAKIDLQMPLYQIAAGPTLYPGQKIEGAYYSLNGAARIKNPDPPPDGWLETFAREVLAKVREGRFPVAPDVGREACGRCEFDPICRIGPRLDRKEWAQERRTGA
ncbi:MAG: PD-(D/E)XK nuclease family protein [Blastocatellia bacterium]